MEFNIDGSLKVPKGFEKKNADSDEIFQNEPTLRITKNQVSQSNPLKCVLSLEFNNRGLDSDLLEKLFHTSTGKFKHMASLLNMTRKNPNNFEVSIVSGQYRCSWCENFINYLDQEMNCEIINETSCMSFSK